MKRNHVSVLKTALTIVFLAGLSISAMGCTLPYFYIPLSHFFE